MSDPSFVEAYAPPWTVPGLSVACPFCGAWRGERCLTGMGRPRRSHITRLQIEEADRA